MEIINNNTEHHPKDITKSKNIYIGIVLILSGIIWMLYNLDMIGRAVFTAFFSWQMLMIALGGYFLTLSKRILGSFFIAFGLVFAISDWFDFPLPLKEILLPAILIAFGVALIWQYIHRK